MPFALLPALVAATLTATDHARRLSYTSIAGYAPSSDVTQFSRVDLDLPDMEWNLESANWAAALAHYENGGNSIKGNGSPRSLKR